MADEKRSDKRNVDLERPLEEKVAGSGQESTTEQARREARRRILAGGLAGAPLLLTLTSRPAFASHCSPSGMDSANVSRIHDVVCLGRTPGFWKTHEQKCSQYVNVGPCNPINEDGGQCDDFSIPTEDQLNAYITKLKEKESKNRRKIEAAEDYLDKLQTWPNPTWFFGTPFSEIFGSGYTTNPNTTMMQALWLDDEPPAPPVGMGGPSPVLAHSAAAWFNANEFGVEAYGLSPQDVIDLFQSKVLIDPFGLKDTFEMLNSRS